MNGQNANGLSLDFYRVIIGILLTAIFALLFASDQRLTNQVDEVGRKLDEIGRKLDENRLLMLEIQATLDLIANGLDIQVKPKEQAEPSTAPTPNDGQIAPKAP